MGSDDARYARRAEIRDVAAGLFHPKDRVGTRGCRSDPQPAWIYPLASHPSQAIAESRRVPLRENGENAGRSRPHRPGRHLFPRGHPRRLHHVRHCKAIEDAGLGSATDFLQSPKPKPNSSQTWPPKPSRSKATSSPIPTNSLAPRRWERWPRSWSINSGWWRSRSGWFQPI